MVWEARTPQPQSLPTGSQGGTWPVAAPASPTWDAPSSAVPLPGTLSQTHVHHHGCKRGQLLLGINWLMILSGGWKKILDEVKLIISEPVWAPESQRRSSGRNSLLPGPGNLGPGAALYNVRLPVDYNRQVHFHSWRRRVCLGMLDFILFPNCF